jgi:heptosyltransferase III
MKRILVIRGGAIGDFILTLPALKALRDSYPARHLEILAYKHIAALAENRFYADAVQSIEYGPLSGFFAKGADLDPELCAYFSSFEVVITYLFDPDRIFEENLARAGAPRIVRGPAKIRTGSHAARQLAWPVEELGISVTDYRARIFPSDDDIRFAAEFLGRASRPVIALHIGSGSPQKNWPVDNWISLADYLLQKTGSESVPPSLLVISGEADQVQYARFRERRTNQNILFAEALPLPKLAAVLRTTVFLGHDSGISHLAAAAGANCTLLFGPTDPEIWAPFGDNVRVIRAPKGNLANLRLETVLDGIRYL